MAWTGSRWWLLDANQRRGGFLRDVLPSLSLDRRVMVVVGRAEDLSREAEFRAQFDLVTARSFGPPAVTSECAAGFLRVGGRLAVSEPPDPSNDRWPPEGLAVLGLRPKAVPTGGGGGAVRVLEQVAPCPDRFPRRVGVPRKRPLF